MATSEKEKRMTKRRNTVFLKNNMGGDMAISTHGFLGFKFLFYSHNGLPQFDTLFWAIILINNLEYP
jgi:hypothetical protein